MRRPFFWSGMFVVLTAYSLWTGISFPNSEKLSVKILLKMFSKPLEWDFSPSIPIIYRFDLFRGSVHLEIPIVIVLVVSVMLNGSSSSILSSGLIFYLLTHCVAEISHRVLNPTCWYFLFLPLRLLFPQILVSVEFMFHVMSSSPS